MRSLGLELVGFNSSCHKGSTKTNNEQFSASYGVSADTLSIVYKDLKMENPDQNVKDFLLAMNALKIYLTEKAMAEKWGCDKKHIVRDGRKILL